MLALRFAEGWYRDTDNNWPGWGRVLSLDGGRMTFHIPDDFPVGDLEEIKPNWDGHTTVGKWTRVMHMAGVLDKEDRPLRAPRATLRISQGAEEGAMILNVQFDPPISDAPNPLKGGVFALDLINVVTSPAVLYLRAEWK